MLKPISSNKTLYLSHEGAKDLNAEEPEVADVLPPDLVRAGDAQLDLLARARLVRVVSVPQESDD